MSNLTYIEDLRKEIENLCGNCDRPDKEKVGRMIISSMAMGFNAGMKTQLADRLQEKCEFCKDGGFIGARLILGNDGNWHEINFCPNCGCRVKGADD